MRLSTILISIALTMSACTEDRISATQPPGAEDGVVALRAYTRTCEGTGKISIRGPHRGAFRIKTYDLQMRPNGGQITTMPLPPGEFEVTSISCGRGRSAMRASSGISGHMAKFSVSGGEVVYVGDFVLSTYVKKREGLLPQLSRRKGVFVLDVMDKSDIARRLLSNQAPALAEPMVTRLATVSEGS